MSDVSSVLSSEVIITGIFALLGALVGATIPIYLKNRYTKRERKMFEISKLEGLSIVRRQWYLSRFEALVYSHYHEYRYRLSKESHDFTEAMRWMKKSEDLALEIAKYNQQFLESLGIIFILYMKDKEILKLVEENRTFNSPVLQEPTTDYDLDALLNYKTQAVQKLQELIDKEYGESVEDLIRKLRMKI